MAVSLRRPEGFNGPCSSLLLSVRLPPKPIDTGLTISNLPPENRNAFFMDEDFQQLSQYARSKDDAAFRGLVERHAALVRGVALRRTQDPELADEVTNSVFVLLARKAGSVRGSLRGWLYNTSFLESGNALRKARLYQRKMEELRMQSHQPENEGGEAAWEEVSLRLDEAMSLLESGSRDLLIMRFYERKSLREIAGVLGKSEEASRKLISRSLERLSERLRRKGLLTSVSGLGTLLAAQNLCPSTASASVIAANAISAASAGSTSALAPLLQTVAGASPAKAAVIGFLLAALPAGYFWVQNRSLQEELATLRTVRPSAATVPARTALSPSSVMGTPVEPDPGNAVSGTARKQETEENFFKRGKDHGLKEAAREITRLSLTIPDLTPDQKNKIRVLLETRNQEKSDRFAQALQSGALLRSATAPESLTDADRLVLDGLRVEDSDENDPVGNLLTESQRPRYFEAREARRLASAESTASDSLKTLGQLFDLNDGQKDAIFQTLAAHELGAQKEWGPEIPFADSLRDAGRHRLIRTLLSGEQAAIFENHVKEENMRRQQFLQMMSGQAPAP